MSETFRRLNRKEFIRLQMKELNDKQEFVWRISSICALFLQIFMFASLIIISYCFEAPEHINKLFNGHFDNLELDLLIIALLFIMYLSIIVNKIPNRIMVFFSLIIFINAFSVFLDGFWSFIDGVPYFRNTNFILNTLFYFLNIVLAWLYWNFIYSLIDKSSKPYGIATHCVNIISVVGALMLIGNIFFGYYFTVSPLGKYMRSPTYFSCLICPTAILIICIVFICRQRLKATEKLILVSYPLLPYLSAVFAFKSTDSSMIGVFTFISVFIIYGNLYVKREKELLQKQVELTETKLNSMILQINPHFIYNTLSSVAGLCSVDGEKAKNMLYSFSNYLRTNLGEMSQKHTISFVKEIENLKLYLDIEKVRFPDIEIIFDLKETSFNLPGLTVQPLVENAIKHGIMGRESGGTVKISSYSDLTAYYILVEDDGVGFTDAPLNDGRNHIGIANVRKRLEIICQGSLLIESEPQIGTKAIIIIPKEDL